MTARRLGAVMVALAVFAGVVPVHAHGSQHDVGEHTWRTIIATAERAAARGAYEGEALWANWEDDAANAVLVSVAHRGGGAAATGSRPLRLPDPDRLTAKYRVDVRGNEDVLDRTCARLEIRTHQGELRERIWIDEDSGMLLRRESFEGERLLRLAVFLSLEPRQPPSADAPSEPSSNAESAMLVSDEGVSALRTVGWRVDDELPGGYVRETVHAHGGSAGPPLQVVYSDGLYAVSLFQQHGSPDPDSLPAGAELTEDVLDGPAYHWPGAVPRRLVWSDGTTTYTLVGDAPEQEFERIAQVFPNPSPRSAFQRLRAWLTSWLADATGWPR